MLARRSVLFFVYSSATLLGITAIAKILSAGGDAHILLVQDPVLLMPYRYLFYIVGTCELFVAFHCVFGTRSGLKVALLAGLSTSLLAYRVGVWWLGFKKPCPCLGNLTDALHISPEGAGIMMKIVLAYLLFGSYLSLMWLRREQQGASDGTADL